MVRIITYKEGQAQLDLGFKGYLLTCYLAKGEHGTFLMTPSMKFRDVRVTNAILEKKISKDLNITMDELWLQLLQRGFEPYEFLDERIIMFDLIDEDINYGNN